MAFEAEYTSDNVAVYTVSTDNAVPTDADFNGTPPAGTIVVQDAGDGTGTLHVRMSDGTWGTVAIV